MALEFLPDLPGPDGALDAHGWVGDGRIALFAATAASAVAEVQLLDGSEIIDRVSPDETGLALVAGTGDLSTLIVVAVDGQGTPLATCSRDPEYTSLLACAPA